MTQERRLCIALDASLTSQAALEWAACSLVNRGDDVRLLTVVPPSVRSELCISGHFQGTAVAGEVEGEPSDLQRSLKLLKQCKAKMVAHGVQASQVRCETLVAPVGTAHDIGREVSRYAEECGCESLVMGSRGLGITQRALSNLFGVGSVSDWVLHHAPCNVIIHKDAATVAAAAEAVPEAHKG